MAEADCLISFIIVNYQTSHLVRRLHASLQNVTIPHEIIVVDNASPNSDWQDLQDLPIALIRSDTNLGYGLGCNLGAQQARGEFLCILNPDIIIPEREVEKWVAIARGLLAQQRPVGIVAPRLTYENGVEQLSAYRFPTMWSYWPAHSIFAGAIKYARKRLGFGSRTAHSSLKSVDWVMGSAMLIPRAAWDCVGGFSSRYFFYAEDTDLCWRMRRAGFEVFYAPEVTLIHTQGESAPEKRAEACKRLFSGLKVFLVDNYSPAMRKRVEYCVIADMVLRILLLSPALLWRRDDPLVQARLHGYRDVLQMYWKDLR
ncbi:MAG: glycosyltransferase family 2 protein [Candidatus Sumerlaea chitinivorans]|nr:glycosyltransferase family 2 protein [Candidatus Sumerlaea chitinivorans]